MSASDKKQQRKAAMAEGLSQKQRKEQAEAAAAKRKKLAYTAVGVVCAVAAAGLLIWNGMNSWQSRRHLTDVAATVNGESYTVADLQYYYAGARNSFYQQYYQYLSAFGFDPNVSDGAQWYNETENQTYADYFRESALNNLQQIAALCSAAKAEGYTLSEEGQKSIEDELSSLDVLCAQYGTTRSSFLVQNYGSGVTEKVYLRNLTNSVLAAEYSQSHADSITYDDNALKEYYDTHPDALDSYDFRSFFISGVAANPTDADGNPLKDEEGNTVTATDEEKAAAMAQAKEKADQAVAEIRAARDRDAAFVEAAPKYVAENVKDAYANASYSLSTGVVGSTLSSNSSVISSWIMDSGRKDGDVTSLEVSGSGYYVVLFKDRYLVTDPTVDVRHILINPEISDGAAVNSQNVKIPTQEQMDAAKAQAQALIDEWNARPEAERTAENFGKLAEEHSTDTGSNTNGGQYTYVTKGWAVPNFNDWIFDPSRQPGDVGLVENSGDNATYYGWHIIYFENTNDPYWEHVAYEAKQSTEQSEWLTSLTESAEAVAADGMNYVAPANTAVASTPSPSPSEPVESPSESPAA